MYILPKYKILREPPENGRENQRKRVLKKIKGARCKKRKIKKHIGQLRKELADVPFCGRIKLL